MAYDNYGRDNYRRDDRRGGPSSRPRPVRITEPTEVDVLSNLYQYTGTPITLYQYTVTITPEVRRAIMFDKFQRIVEHNKAFTDISVAFDGYNTLVSNTQFDDLTLEYPLKEGVMQCKIEFRNAVKSDNGNNVELINCFNILVKHYQRMNFFVDRKKIMCPGNRATPIGTGLEVMSGLVANFIRTNNKALYLNLDQSFGVFYKAQPLLDLIRDFTDSNRSFGSIDSPAPELYYALEKYIKKLRLRTTHRGERNKTFLAWGLCKETATDKVIRFTAKDASTEEEMTVAEYFRKTYGELKYPRLPLITFKVRQQEIFIPIEVLEIVPMQRYVPKLNEAMTASMIKIAAKRPDDRFRIIQEKAEELKMFKNEVLDKFGIAFDNRFLNCKGLVLPAPNIKYANRETEVTQGSWNLRDMSALRPVNIESWKIFYFKSRDKVRGDQIDSFLRVAENYGMKFPRDHPQQIQVQTVEEFYKADKEKFNLIVLPDRNSLRYEDIKRVAETYTGHFTQCVLGSNLGKMGSPAFASNVLLKVNAKLGGENHCLNNQVFSDKNTMLIGLNVSHPDVQDADSPTVVAAVGSIDYNFVNYKTVIKTQERRTEIVGEMKEIIVQLLRAHYSETGKKPDRIIFFRDGTAESTFQAVFHAEMTALREACSSIEKNYHPELNFIVTQKRHSIRFNSNNQNLIPGSFVSGLSEDNSIDFFLVSAHALQGTARPTRYKVILNESSFTQETLFENVYSLCHLYARATKSVSVVPPIYYADLATQRGRAYLERNDNNEITMRDVISEISNNLFYL